MAKGASRSAANHVVKEKCSVDVDPSVPTSLEQVELIAAFNYIFNFIYICVMKCKLSLFTTSPMLILKAFNEKNENIQGKQTDSDVIAEVSEVNEKHLSSRVRAQRARRKKEHEISSESVKKPKKILSNSALEQQTGNNTTSNTMRSQEAADKFPLAHARIDSEKDELLGNAKDHSSCEVKNTVSY